MLGNDPFRDLIPQQKWLTLFIFNFETGFSAHRSVFHLLLVSTLTWAQRSYITLWYVAAERKSYEPFIVVEYNLHILVQLCCSLRSDPQMKGFPWKAHLYSFNSDCKCCFVEHVLFWSKCEHIEGFPSFQHTYHAAFNRFQFQSLINSLNE